ncbi:MAG: hypothetical protein MJK08_12930 [Campylobacterales bacterium]|nr:hypothetical protein [Campylobacterales bacterium]
MNIFFTFDYELFFGSESGSLYNCIIKPTNELIKISEKYNVNFVFFVDSGYLIKLNEYRKKFPNLNDDYDLIINQIKYLYKTGHDIQLHIHPHWEDSHFNGKKWIIDTKRYRLHDFEEEDINDIVYRYKKCLTDLTDNNIFAFRAGGWCIQPFNKIRDALKNNDIYLDSTVYKNGLNLSKTHYIDFRNMPDKDEWKFEDNPLKENKNGYFREIPISAYKLSPLFFWKFAVTKKFATKKHKIFGDGSPVGAAKKSIIKMLTRTSYSVVSCDGYKSSFLFNAYEEYKRHKKSNLIVIGHPKASSEYSLNKLNKFIKSLDKNDIITTFKEKY